MYSRNVSFKAVLALILSSLLIITSCDQGNEGGKLSSENKIANFKIEGFESSDNGDSTFTVSVPTGTDISALKTVFTLPAGATSVPASGTAIKFENGVAQTITVTAEDGSKAVYKVTVKIVAKSNDSTIKSSTIGELNDKNIAKIPKGTTVADFKEALTTNSNKAKIEIYNADGTTVATELTSESVLIVTAEDGSKTTYTLAVETQVTSSIQFTDQNYDFDGGIEAVVKKVPTKSGKIAKLTPPLKVTGVITAIDTHKTYANFTIQDRNSAVTIMGKTTEKVGTKVELFAAEVKNNYDLLQVTVSSNIKKISTNNKLYVQDISKEALKASNKHQLFRYTGYANGQKSTKQYSRSYYLDTEGFSYWNVSNNSDFQKIIDTNKGSFYGTLCVYGSEYTLAVPSKEHFVPNGSKIEAKEIADVISSIKRPYVIDSKLKFPYVPNGFTIKIKDSKNTAISKDGSIEQGDDPITGTVDFTVTRTEDNSSANTNVFEVTVPEKRLSTSGKATDLFISEYIEGTSSNKAIEIANYTGSEIDLSNYKLVLFNGKNISDLSDHTKGSNPWIGSDKIANNGTFTIGNEKATFKSNVTSTVTFFNGDDTVCLYRTSNGGTTWELIDVVGTNDKSNFAIDKTLVRKQGEGPSKEYNATEWFELPLNYFKDLGKHVF